MTATLAGGVPVLIVDPTAGDAGSNCDASGLRILASSDAENFGQNLALDLSNPLRVMPSPLHGR